MVIGTQEWQGAWPIPNWGDAWNFMYSLLSLKPITSGHQKDEGGCFTEPQVNHWIVLMDLACMQQALRFAAAPAAEFSTRCSCFLWGSWSPAQCLTLTPVDAFSCVFSEGSYPVNVSHKIQKLGLGKISKPWDCLLPVKAWVISPHIFLPYHCFMKLLLLLKLPLFADL